MPVDSKGQWDYNSLAKARNYTIALLLFFFTLSAIEYFVVSHDRDTSAQNNLNHIRSGVHKNSVKVSNALLKIETIVNSMEQEIGSGELSMGQVEQRIRQELQDSSWMYGLGVALQPDSPRFSGNRDSLYYVFKADEVIVKPIEYDHTKFEYEWYRKPLLEGKLWQEPYYGITSETVLLEFGAPFWLPGRKEGKDPPSGVITGNLSVEKLRNLIDFDNELVAYYYMLSPHGRFVLHPDDKQVLSENTIFQFAWDQNDPSLNSIAMKALGGKPGSVEHISPHTDEKSWIVFEPVEATNSSLIVVVDKTRLLDLDKNRRDWFRMVPLVVVSASVLVLLIMITPYGPSFSALYASIIISLLVFVGVGSLWAIADYYPKEEEGNELKVVSKNVLSEFRDQSLSQTSGSTTDEPKFIKTGVYLQSVEFEGSNNIQVTAYVWQHYAKGLHAGLQRGFVLPEADSPSIEETYREMDDPESEGCKKHSQPRDCEELIGWYVLANLRQDFDYSHYPLDAQQVWFRMWHKEFRDNVILIPDLDAYSRPNPKAKPGLQQPFVLPGWRLEESWFSIQKQQFNTNFGDNDSLSLNEKPELLFNLRIKREFLNPFVSRVIPLILVAILMFLIVLISTKSSRESEWLGFSASNTVAGLSALFFVVGINHADLRQSLQSPSIMYFEYFYFVIYVMLLYVAVGSIRIAKQSVIDGRDENMVASLVYWPALSLVLFVLTFAVFY
jgi:hypothetical protein